MVNDALFVVFNKLLRRETKQKLFAHQNTRKNNSSSSNSSLVDKNIYYNILLS